MALNHDFIGRHHRSGEVYEVSREKIREYAIATGDLNALYLDPAEAKAAGYPDVIAPPSFAFMLFFRLGAWPLHDPEFGKEKEPVCVLRTQQIIHRRPIRAGDLLVQEMIVNEVKDIGRHEQFVMTQEIATVDGEHVCTVISTIVSRGTTEAEDR